MAIKIISVDSHTTEPPDTYTARIDGIAFRMVDMVNFRHLLWANDFRHSDSTWPWSQDVLAAHTRDLGADQCDAILHDNVAELYRP